MVRYLNARVRRIAPLTRILFGVKVNGGDRIQWDLTTLALKMCLKRWVQSGQNVLEIGTGPYAVLSIHLAKHCCCKIVAVDVNEEYVSAARETVMENHVSVDVFCSDLFAAVQGMFDVILFNSTYVPRGRGRELGFAKLHRRETDWCGGETGLETIERFLGDARSRLSPDGRVILGINSLYVSVNQVAKLCEDQGYSLRNCHAPLVNPSRVLRLGRTHPC